MALYEDGKMKFTDEWIDSVTSDESLKEFLKIKRYNLVDRKNSSYCTVENLLYNKDIDELIDDAYHYMCGYKKMTNKNYEKIFVENTVILDSFKKVLQDIYSDMIEENDWHQLG